LAAFGAPVGDLEPGDLARPGMVFQMGVAQNRIDVVTSIEAVEFEPAWSRKCAWEYGGLPVHVLSREDLIANKRAVDRPQDRIDVAELERGWSRRLQPVRGRRARPPVDRSPPRSQG
jgi:hypothetical protein